MFYFGLISPGYGWRFLWPYVIFFRPDFHPWQRDDSQLIMHYEQQLVPLLRREEPRDRGAA